MKVGVPGIDELQRKLLSQAGISEKDFSNMIKIEQGLFSGKRDTDYTNSSLNACSIKMVQSDM